VDIGGGLLKLFSGAQGVDGGHDAARGSEVLHRALRKGGLRRGYQEVEVDIVLERCGKN